MATFTLDPYQADINPGTENGSKLYLKACAKVEKEKRIAIVTEQAKQIKRYFESLNDQFGWSSLTGSVPSAADGNNYSIFSNTAKLTVEDVQRQAAGYLRVNDSNVTSPLAAEDIDAQGNNAHRPRFYNRVRSSMIAKAIEGHIDHAS